MIRKEGREGAGRLKRWVAYSFVPFSIAGVSFGRHDPLMSCKLSRETYGEMEDG
jgi:hypothetical protein